MNKHPYRDTTAGAPGIRMCADCGDVEEASQHQLDPATCGVALLRDAADRKVAQIGTDCISDEDCEILQQTAEATGDAQCLLWLGHTETTQVNWYSACGFSARFIAICQHFRSQGYDYLWFDADRETPVAQAEKLPASDTPEPTDAAREYAAVLQHHDEHRAQQVLNAIDETGSAPRPEPVNARLLAALEFCLPYTLAEYTRCLNTMSELSAEAVEEYQREPEFIRIRDGVKSAEAAIAEAEQGAPTIIRLDIWRGSFERCEGLPPGVTLEVHDMDPNYDEQEPCEQHPDENCCIREFTG